MSNVVKITWAWDENRAIQFDPAADSLDFGWMAADSFTIQEVNGAVVIAIPSNNQTYTLLGVTLASLSLANIKALDATASTAWQAALSGTSDGGTTTPPGSGGGTTTPPGSGGGTTTPPGSGGGGTTTPPSGDIATWSATAVYVAGDLVRVGDTVYQAGWWTRGDDPNLVNGAAGSGKVWTVVDSSSGGTGSGSGGTGGGSGGSGGTTPPAGDIAAWSATTVYLAGDLVQLGDSIYKAGWWTQGDDPSLMHGGPGSGMVWTLVGSDPTPGDTTPVAPHAPTHVSVIQQGSGTALLTWDEVDTTAGLSFLVFQNGQQIGETNGRSFTATQLTFGEQYSFTVVAKLADLLSVPSDPGTILIRPPADPNAPAGADSFSPYIDMLLGGSVHVVDMAQAAGLHAVTLAFLTSSGTDQIGWGGYGDVTHAQLYSGQSMASVIGQLQASGIDVTISFGGAFGQEAALTATSAQALAAAYAQVIDTYHVTKLDFDIEGGAIANVQANTLRAQALAMLQQAHPELELTFTLPVTTQGLDANGMALLRSVQAAGVQVDHVNIMAMDYGPYYASADAGNDAIRAAEATIRQLDSIGMGADLIVTPMIGINDVQAEIFTLEDAQQLVDYVAANDRVSGISMWSLSRDNGSAVGYVSPTGSGLTQGVYDFSQVFNTVTDHPLV